MRFAAIGAMMSRSRSTARLGDDRERVLVLGEHLEHARVIFHSRSIGW
jgi:hypothetical protein